MAKVELVCVCVVQGRPQINEGWRRQDPKWTQHNDTQARSENGHSPIAMPHPSLSYRRTGREVRRRRELHGGVRHARDESAEQKKKKNHKETWRGKGPFSLFRLVGNGSSQGKGWKGTMSRGCWRPKLMLQAGGSLSAKRKNRTQGSWLPSCLCRLGVTCRGVGSTWG